MVPIDSFDQGDVIPQIDPNYKAEQFSLILDSLICKNSPLMRYADKPQSIQLSSFELTASARDEEKHSRKIGESTAKIGQNLPNEPSENRQKNQCFPHESEIFANGENATLTNPIRRLSSVERLGYDPSSRFR
jgi:hypothetical protein